MRDQEQSRFILGKVGEEWAVFDTETGNHLCCPDLTDAETAVKNAEYYVQQGGRMIAPKLWHEEEKLTGIVATRWEP